MQLKKFIKHAVSVLKTIRASILSCVSPQLLYYCYITLLPWNANPCLNSSFSCTQCGHVCLTNGRMEERMWEWYIRCNSVMGITGLDCEWVIQQGTGPVLTSNDPSALWVCACHQTEFEKENKHNCKGDANLAAFLNDRIKSCGLSLRNWHFRAVN